MGETFSCELNKFGGGLNNAEYDQHWWDLHPKHIESTETVAYVPYFSYRRSLSSTYNQHSSW